MLSHRVARRLLAWLALALATGSAGEASPTELERLCPLAPDLRPAVLERALAALACSSDPRLPRARVLAVIDYSLPSTAERLWVFDRESPRLVAHALVAHGSGSGENVAERFSNRHGTRQSSLGLFRAAETYHGRNGYSLRLDGLDSGVNDQARARAIVMHGARYATSAFAARHGRLGRSWGCPAIDPERAREVIDLLREGGALFVSAEDATWLAELGRRVCPSSGRAADPVRPPSSRPGAPR